MDDVNTPAARLPSAPRHLNRRRFLPAVPDARFLSRGSTPPDTATVRDPGPRAMNAPRRPSEPRHKRMVALALVIAVTAAVPALVLALIFLP